MIYLLLHTFVTRALTIIVKKKTYNTPKKKNYKSTNCHKKLHKICDKNKLL